eukprot:m.196804 g.196804  ORF g.196804 m.196804 type:complete len:91 (+) comp25072_c0_seq2:94-366(+)
MAEAGDYGGTDDAASAAATPGGKGNPKPPKRARPPDVVQPPAAMKVDVPKLRAPPPPALLMYVNLFHFVLMTSPAQRCPRQQCPWISSNT